MDIQSYQFTVYAMLIGMFIVFGAMILFSVIMVALKAAVRERRAAGQGAGPEAKSGAAGAAKPAAGGARPLPGWAIVAVAAFLTAEAETREGPSAEPWRPEVNQYDPWLAGGKFSRRVGV